MISYRQLLRKEMIRKCKDEKERKYKGITIEEKMYVDQIRIAQIRLFYALKRIPRVEVPKHYKTL